MKYITILRNKLKQLWNYFPAYIRYGLSFILVLCVLTFGFWKISDIISEYKYNKKIKEYEVLQNIIIEKNKLLIEKNIKLENEKNSINKDLEESKSREDKLIKSFENVKSQVVYINKDLGKSKSNYEKELNNINKPVSDSERLARLCKTRKELGYIGGICGSN